MAESKWEKAKEIFAQAVELEASKRAAYLEAACAGDGELLELIQKLLRADLEAGSFIETPVLAMAPAEESRLDKHLGPYKIEREIGRGGMGVVYLAVRDDDQYKKRVALKLVKRGMDSDEIIRRFRHERQTLAALDHPNIARLLDGGTTPEGLPYFVMEYIEGRPIDEYCDSQKLNTRERLELFRKVCAAVQYAHQNLIVHRDLKPSNILVTAGGEPKLLDFGIAKLLNPELSPISIQLTQTGMQVMTPEYASPEQVRGESITTASDVYTLGVLLYELLTGHRPYRFKTRVQQEIVRVICEVEPEKPSTAISRVDEAVEEDGSGVVKITPESVSETREGQPDKLRRRLAGDLDNIVLMALRKEPRRRYSSAEQFSEDIHRHLEGLPVRARQDTPWYRSAKFIQRHRWGVSASALLVLSLLGGIAGTAWQASVAEKERDKARLEAQKAKQVSQFLVDLFKVSDPSESKGDTITAREILERGAMQIEVELKDQPEVQATLMNTLGEVYRSLGLYENARKFLELSLITRKRILGEENLEVSESKNDLANLFVDLGKYAEAETLFHEALAVRRKQLNPDHEDLAASLNNLALLLHKKGDNAAAEPLMREALMIVRKRLGNEHQDVVITINNLATLLHEKGDYEDAEQLYREAIATIRKLLGPDHPNVAIILGNLSLMLQDKGDYEAAEPALREAIAIQSKVLGGDHPNVAVNLNNLGLLLQMKRAYGTADSAFRESLRIAREKLGDENPNTAAIFNNWAQLFNDKGDYVSAEPALRESLEIINKVFPQGHWRIALARSRLGECLGALQRFEEAEPLLVESYPLLKTKRGEHDKNTKAALERIIDFYDAWNKPEKAAEYRAMLPGETAK